MSDFNISWTYTTIDKISAPLDKIEKKIEAVSFEMKKQEGIFKRNALSIQNYGEKLKSFGTTLSLGLTAPLVGLATASFKAALEAEKSDQRFLAFFQGNKQKAEQLLAVVDKIFYATGAIGKEKLEGATLKLLQSGVPIEEIGDKLGYMSDIALGANIPIEKLAQNFKRISDNPKALARITKQLEMSGVAMSKALQKVTGLPMKQINEMMKHGAIGVKTYEAALKSMTEKGGLYYGASATASDTLASSLDKLKEASIELLEELGFALTGAGNLPDNINKLTEKVLFLKTTIGDFSKENPKITQMAAGFGAVLAAAGPLIYVFGRLAGFAIKFTTAARFGVWGVALWGVYEAATYLYDEFESIRNIVDQIASLLDFIFPNHEDKYKQFVVNQKNSSNSDFMGPTMPTFADSINGYLSKLNILNGSNNSSEITLNINDPTGVVKSVDSNDENLNVNTRTGANMKSLLMGY
jgi:hypothetical protein